MVDSIQYDVSYGIIPLQQKKGEWYVFLIQMPAGYWSFPKGHPNPGETELQAAKRELFEETGLSVSTVLFPQSFEERYEFQRAGQRIRKSVYYFVAEVTGQIALQSTEIQNGKWVLLSKASQYVTFSEGKALCQQILQLMSAR
ncbi:NUDIX domain-containing protein [Parachlamydia sp. AcF125]|uniref:bis(5'-nucleosyl)-tetraphosphatase n=1 Tax=Parachlamydia sp. AcF125 TaxID=2795736 RepID=UPI001BCA5509|nr:NUDIX domain-containing protein [Parachlamydia sp. AcF125]MBS4168496.1 Diadenosine hexaphosphate hydrolase [Parachlamydia sp. AcF125]